METEITTEAPPQQLGEACGSSMSAWLYLVRVYDKMQRHLMDHLDNYDLTLAQYDVLALLSQEQGITQQALAQKLLVTKGNVCGLIDRMSAHGLVERRSDPEDRRPNLLHLTAEGERLAKEAVPAYSEFVREHMSGLTPQQLAALREILQTLDNSIRQH